MWAFAAHAEPWSVQTVAVRDLRIAQRMAADLAAVQFDAFTEFAMNRGQQWVRVRVGCYLDRSDAEAVADLLRERYTRDAVVVPQEGRAPVPCIAREVGFVVPETWRQSAPGQPSFEVEVAGVLGLIRFQNGRWQVLQAPATDALLPPAPTSGRFEQGAGLPVPFVRMRSPTGPRLVCLGTLLAQTPDVAIVEHEGVVSACRPIAEAAP